MCHMCKAYGRRPIIIWYLYCIKCCRYIKTSCLSILEQIYFYAENETECYHFREDDRVGVFIEDVPAAIPYAFDDTTKTVFGRPANSSSSFQLGEETDFDELTLPYFFSVEAYVDTVNGLHLNDTREWVPCPKSVIPDDSPAHGATGHTGATGPAGATGSIGPKGDRGPAGPRGLPGLHGNGSSLQPGASATDTSTILSIVALIWLLLLTIVVVTAIIVVYFFVIKRRQNDTEDFDSEGNIFGHHHTASRKRSKSPSAGDDAVIYCQVTQCRDFSCIHCG